MKKDQFAEQFAQMICAKLDAGVNPFHQEWEGDYRAPMNVATGRAYQGSNIFTLSFMSMARGFTDMRFCSFKQARDKGWHVRKGAKALPVVFWSQTAKETGETNEDGEAVLKGFAFAKCSMVFNVAEIEGDIPALEAKHEQTWSNIAEAEGLLDRSGAKILYDGGNRAFYRPSTDEIHLPERGQFFRQEYFYSTALHELGHWTGHEKRLNRPGVGKELTDRTMYAKEELRAEIASWMLCAELNLRISELEDNHASYIDSWSKILKERPVEILKACTDADKIRQYILNGCQG